MAKLFEVRKTLAYYLARPAVLLLARTPITPGIISWSGFMLAIGATALIITGHLFAAGFVVLISGFFDILDGALARYIKQATPFGAVLDSTLDRLSEALLLVGVLAAFLLTQESSALFVLVSKGWAILFVCLALPCSLIVSYIRARAETQGLECQVGLFTRTERVIVLALGLLLSQVGGALVITLAIIVVFSFFTIVQRLLYIRQQTKNR
ncbi:Phosphatidylinositol phosphate synthase [subsurface metagenome]